MNLQETGASSQRDMNSLKVAMAGEKGAYGCDAARKKLGEETAVQGAVRGSGEVFFGVVEVSGAAKSRRRDRSSVNGTDGVLEVGSAGKKKRNPTPLFIAARW